MDIGKYTKLFNYGYFLSKHAPKLLDRFTSATKDVGWISEPLKAGEAQYKRERFKDRLKSIPKSPSPSNEKDKGKEPDR